MRQRVATTDLCRRAPGRPWIAVALISRLFPSLLLTVIGCGGSAVFQATPDAGVGSFVVSGQGGDGVFRAIADESTSPSPTNGTDFGPWNTGTIGNPLPPKVLSYEITNDGSSALAVLGPPAVEVRGADAVRFAVTGPSVSSVSASATVQFTISFDGGGAVGQHSAQAVVHIASGDFVFVITGQSTTVSIH